MRDDEIIGLAFPPNADFKEKVHFYLERGYELKYAEYFAGGSHKITVVHPNEDFSLTLTFDNGEKRRLDCKPLFASGTVCELLKSFEFFKKVYLDRFHSVCWDIDPNLDSQIHWDNVIDIDPCYCYVKSVPIDEGE